MSKVKVRVGDKVHEYPADVAGFRRWRATHPKVLDLHDAKLSARDAGGKVTVWMWFDRDGLAYKVEMSRSGSYKILAAAPIDGSDDTAGVFGINIERR